MRTVPILKIGNGQAVVLPKDMEFPGAINLEITKNGDTITLRPAAPSYTLSELLEASQKSALVRDDEDRQWLNAAPVGKE